MIKTHNYDLYPQGEYDAPWEDDENDEGDFIVDDFIAPCRGCSEYEDEEDYLHDKWDGR